MTSFQTSRETETIAEKNAKEMVETMAALHYAYDELSLVVEQWTKLAGLDSLITQIQVAPSSSLPEIEESTKYFQKLNRAAEVGNDCIRILDHPALSMLLGLENARSLEQHTQHVIQLIANTTSEHERFQGIEQLKSIQIELQDVESRLNESANPLSNRNREINQRLMAGNVATETQTDMHSAVDVGTALHVAETSYLSAHDQARLSYQRQQVLLHNHQLAYTPPDPPLMLVNKVIAGTSFESAPIQPIQLVLFIEPAAQGFRAWLTENENEQVPLRVLPVTGEQVMELGKKIRDTILINSDRLYKYYNPRNIFTETQLQEDWRELAETGTYILDQIFDPVSLETLKT
ncbi:MAG TPA: hypothetical protein VI338_01125, partial [Nitrososphaera sp.]|nr:hypothetical protein [Nitrososphaera sp.]